MTYYQIQFKVLQKLLLPWDITILQNQNVKDATWWEERTNSPQVVLWLPHIFCGTGTPTSIYTQNKCNLNLKKKWCPSPLWFLQTKSTKEKDSGCMKKQCNKNSVWKSNRPGCVLWSSRSYVEAKRDLKNNIYLVILKQGVSFTWR